MAFTMQVKRLLQDELCYEVKIRGIATGTVDEMRHSLAMALRLEKSGGSIRYPTYPFSIQEDIEAVEKKLSDLAPLVDDFSGDASSSAFGKLQSRLSHVLNRIDHIATDGPEAQKRSELLARTLSLLDSLERKSGQSNKTDIPPQLAALDLPNVTTTPQPIRRSSGINDTSFHGNNFKQILPIKWNLKFSGDKKGLSLNSFLERVEELRIARHVSKDILLESGIDLFEGRAYQFYLAYRDEVETWDDFVTLLREEYLSPSYNEKLLKEITKRTQGPDESIGIYLAVMAGYFNRMTCPVSEEVKMKIILRNIAPFYQNHLALVEVKSLSHLRELCRRLEVSKESVENFVTPSRRNCCLEPDLAYIEVENSVDSIASTSKTDNTVDKSATSMIVCYRCGTPGHKAIGCTSVQGKFCYRCKKEGYTVRNCPNCVRKGNDSRRVQ